MIHEEDLDVVRREEERFGKGGGADHHDEVPRLEAGRPGNDGVGVVEPPVGGLPLRLAQGPVLLAPTRERRQAQPSRDDAVHVLEEEHLGEQVLILGTRLQLAHRLVTDLEQVRTRDRVLVFLDALQNELLVLLLERAGGTGGPRRRKPLGGG